MPDLSFIKCKINRADVHIKAANAIAKTHCESDFYRSEVKPNGNGRYHLRVIEVTPLPPEFSILLGEIAYQLRSGLDHLAFAFCAPQNRHEEKAVQFPFVGIRREWRATAARQLPGISREAKRCFERFQPYHSRKEPSVKNLWCINAVNNWEKHRAPATAVFGVQSSRGRIGIPSEMRARNFKYFPRKIIKKGAILASFDAEKATSDFHVHMDSQTMFSPVFDEPMTRIAKLKVFEILVRS